MDCRKALWLAGLVFTGLAGCSQTGTVVTETVVSKTPGAPVDPPIPKVQKAADANKPLKPSTYVAMGDVQAQRALDERNDPQVREAAADNARKAYQYAIQLDPKYVQGHCSLARFLLAQGDRTNSIKTYQKAIEIQPKHPELWYELGMVHAKGKDWDAASDCLQQALAQDPDSKRYRKSLGFVLACGGKYDEAYECLSKAMPEAQARYYMARVFADQEQLDAARGQLVLALKAKPNHPEAQAMLESLNSNAIQPVNYSTPAPPVPQPQYPAKRPTVTVEPLK